MGSGTHFSSHHVLTPALLSCFFPDDHVKYVVMLAVILFLMDAFSAFVFKHQVSETLTQYLIGGNLAVSCSPWRDHYSFLFAHDQFFMPLHVIRHEKFHRAVYDRSGFVQKGRHEKLSCQVLLFQTVRLPPSRHAPAARHTKYLPCRVVSTFRQCFKRNRRVLAHYSPSWSCSSRSKPIRLPSNTDNREYSLLVLNPNLRWWRRRSSRRT